MKRIIYSEDEPAVKPKAKPVEPLPKKDISDKKILLIIILIIISVIILIVVGIVIYFFFIKKKEIKEKNYISSTYKIKANEKMSFLNLNGIGLKDKDYSIEEENFLSESNNRALRNLRSVAVKEGSYVPEESGIISVKIIFKITLKSLDKLFIDNAALIKVNLTGLEMEGVTSMRSTFSGCINLKDIDLEGINSQNLIHMEYTFQNCMELKNINLSPIYSSNLINTINIFAGCINLQFINLTSFTKVDEHMFIDLKSTPKIIANTFISSDITNIFYKLFQININIIIEGSNQGQLQCEIGEKEKCQTCDNNIKGNCLTCNYGYFLPFNEIENKKCLPCNKIENCLTCFGDKNRVICSSCESGYILQNDKCEKNEENIQDCIIGVNEKCKTCNSDPIKKNQCGECNIGFYLPSNGNKIICETCNKILNCIECLGTKEDIICSKCEDGYEIINNKCEIKQTCVIGDEEKCSSCKNENGKEKECNTCNEGYFIPENTNVYTCSKCTLNNCKSCFGKINQDICLECKENFESIKSDNNKIVSCNCPSNYKYSDGICKEYHNWIEIIHDTTYTHFKMFIINNVFLKLKFNEIDIYVNDSLIPLEISDSGNEDFIYQFPETGFHKININIKKKLTTLYYAFTNGGGYFKSFRILPDFDSSQVTSMKMFLSNTGFDYCDLKYLDTRNVIDFEKFLWYSVELTSLDLTNFNTSKAKNLRKMFGEDKKMNMLDLSSFDTSNVIFCKLMFHDFSRNCTIKISNRFSKFKEQIRFDNQIINIDELSCNYFENCKQWNGSQETLYCKKCKIGYEIKNGKCFEPKCILGENEKCSKCQTITGIENECLECNEGYYLPSNSLNKKICSKCSIDGCKICENNICKECKLFYEPIINSGNINQCKLTCDLGDENKCLTCNIEEGKKHECGSCNSGYRLLKNGICQKIENSYIAIYKLTSKINKIHILCRCENEIQISDIEMYVNGTKVTPYYLTERCWRNQVDYDYIAYDFPSSGEYEVKIIFKKTLIDMQYLFHTVDYMINITFNETFDTSHVLNMKYLFSNCDYLKYINVSSFNRTLLGDFYSTFDDCKELTFLDLSSFDIRNYDRGTLITNNINLKYIDISSFDLSVYSDVNFLGVYLKMQK